MGTAGSMPSPKLWWRTSPLTEGFGSFSYFSPVFIGQKKTWLGTSRKEIENMNLWIVKQIWKRQSKRKSHEFESNCSQNLVKLMKTPHPSFVHGRLVVLVQLGKDRAHVQVRPSHCDVIGLQRHLWLLTKEWKWQAFSMPLMGMNHPNMVFPWDNCHASYTI